MKPTKIKSLACIASLTLTVALTVPTTFQNARAAEAGVPRFEPDPYWPKPLPNNWMLGQVSGIYVDSHDHIWVTSRPRTLDNNDKYAALNPPASRLLHPRAAGHRIRCRRATSFKDGAARARVTSGPTTNTACSSTTKTTSGWAATPKRTPTS